jgi:cell fate (sporulation/competence/biofilm development) regulator YlbF (YheA/YmcA/DUF963 family)
MSLNHPDGAVMTKVRDLCSTLATDPSFVQIRDRISVFMADENAQSQYEEVSSLSQSLQHKQRQGTQLSEQEIADFEAKRDLLLANPVAKGYLDAQEEMNEVRQSVSMYVMKTFEIGRLPAEEDFQSCGHGCSCGH